MELRITELEEMLKPWAYEIIDEKKKKTGINVGSVVTLEETEKKDKITYTIVGSQEASILDGKISNESPIGRALIGKNGGDIITIMAPSWQAEYSILKVL
jgi:transcription elongation factor GreA